MEEILKAFLFNKDKEINIALSRSYRGFGITKEMAEYMNIDYVPYNDLFHANRSDQYLIGAIMATKPKDIIIETVTLEDVCLLHIDDRGGYEIITYNRSLDNPLSDYLFNLKN